MPRSSIKILRTTDRTFDQEFDRFLSRSQGSSTQIEATVRKIIDDVRSRGDRALLAYTKKFDRNRAVRLEVSKKEIDEAYQKTGAQEIESLKLAAKRIERFHRIQITKVSRSWGVKQDGVALGELIRPLDRV